LSAENNACNFESTKNIKDMAHVIDNSASLSVPKVKISSSKTASGLWAKLFGDIEFNRVGLCAIVLLVVGILGGGAIGLGGMDSAFEIALLIFPTMAVLTTIIAVQPMKYVLGLAVVAILVDVVVIVANLMYGNPIM
jgi:hypothetical protein